MEVKVSTDKKIVKMFRRLEEFLDSEGLTDAKSVDFQNVETGRVFATFVTPNSFREFLQGLALLEEDLAAALETIDILKDDNALLALIDAQNEVLMGRVLTGDSDKEDGAGWPTDGVCGADDCPCNTTEASSPNFVAETTVKENFNVEHVSVTLDEYEELLNLRKKRARDKNTIYQLECKFNAMKKSAQTLQAQRDEYAGRLGMALDDLADADGVTRWIR